MNLLARGAVRLVLLLVGLVAAIALLAGIANRSLLQAVVAGAVLATTAGVWWWIGDAGNRAAEGTRATLPASQAPAGRGAVER